LISFESDGSVLMYLLKKKDVYFGTVAQPLLMSYEHG